MMCKTITEFVCILDQSGSMCGLEKDTIGGFNSMLKKQQKLDDECRITTILFNNESHVIHDRIDIQAVSPLTEKEYVTGGGTALLDTIGYAMDNLMQIQKSTAEPYRANRILFLIITDGEENSSWQYSLPMIKKMIQHEKEAHGWEFIFLGANIDAVKTAGQMGICKDYAVNYVPDEKGTSLNFKVMEDVVTEYRKNGVLPGCCFDEIRADMKERGITTDKTNRPKP